MNRVLMSCSCTLVPNSRCCNPTLCKLGRRAEVDAGATHRVVRDYLAHYGYADTLAAFNGVAGLEAAELSPARCGVGCG